MNSKVRYRNWFYDTGTEDNNGFRIWNNFGRKNNIIIEAFWERKKFEKLPDRLFLKAPPNPNIIYYEDSIGEGEPEKLHYKPFGS